MGRNNDNQWKRKSNWNQNPGIHHRSKHKNYVKKFASEKQKRLLRDLGYECNYSFLTAKNTYLKIEELLGNKNKQVTESIKSNSDILN